MEPTVNTNEELDAVLNQIRFVNTVLDFKWQFEYDAVRINYTAYTADYNRPPDWGWLLWVSFERPDTLTGLVGRGRGRKEMVFRGSTVSGVVKTCWVLVDLMVKHELMEGFQWDGARIFNPHSTVKELSDVQKIHDKNL